MEKAFVLGTVQLGLLYGRNNTASLCSIEEAEKILEIGCQFGVRAFEPPFFPGNDRGRCSVCNRNGSIPLKNR